MRVAPQSDREYVLRMSVNRNYEIAVARLAGEDLSSIAIRYGITRAHASHLAKQNAWMVERCGGAAIPDGLTGRAAIAIFEAIGKWPRDEDKAEIERRALEIFQSPGGRRVIMREIGKWLGVDNN